MWEQFKRRVTNFIYEEVDEEEGQPESSSDRDREQLNKLKRTHESQRVQTRMTFEYPKKDTHSFRFPLIPDEKQADTVQHTDEQRVPSDFKQINHPTRTQKPAYKRRKRRSRNNVNRPYIRQRSVYEQKKIAKELENVPAYVRRRKKITERTDNEQRRPVDSQLQQDTVQSVTHKRETIYSKPAELDAVFKQKKYGDRHEQQSYTENTDASNMRKITDRIESDVIPHTADWIDEKETSFAGNHSQITSTEFSPDEHNDESRSNEQKEQTIERKAHRIKDTDENSMERFNDSHIRERVNKHSVNTFHSKHLDEEQRTNDLLLEQSKMQTQPKEIKINAGNDSSILPHHLLDEATENNTEDRQWLREQKHLLNQTLNHFNIEAEIVAITQGPTVTRIEIQPALGVKVSRIRNLADDIKLHLAAKDIRIEAPIPGKHTVGIEIPNKYPQMVHLQTMIQSETFEAASSPLAVALGLTIEGEPFITDISKMPHGLIAGATGSGKSVCINTIILSLLYKAHYHEVKLMLIDPKMVELTQYNGIPHLLTPVITDAKAATAALKWAVDEMERRYELFVTHQVRNIKRYNRITSAEPLPYIVIIIDELADLMLVSPQEVEDYISRIAQKARAAGIHLILATQRPSVDVITGLIKANIPSRIAFSVSSQVDSRTILDANGAEKLLGKGDMLFIESGTNKHLRLQGPFVSDEEIDRVVAHLQTIAQPNYLLEHEELFLQLENEIEDELFNDVVEFILDEQKASTSMLQRRFRIGYNRAARLIDSMYELGIISAQNGSKPRDVLITRAEWES